MTWNIQLGIILNGIVVDSTTVGGPSHKLISPGDVILRVDGIDATSENVRRLLTGSDVPGTTAFVTVAKQGFQVLCILCLTNVFQILKCVVQEHLEDVNLTRVASERFSDQRHLFEIFSFLKVNK